VEEAWELAALVMSDQDEIEVSVSDKGVALKAKGGAATRIGHAVADALRFFTSPMGFLGDEVDRLRVLRQRSFEDGLIRAHEKALELGVEKPTARTKTLIHWSEGVSSEDVDDPENLIEMWANLLASDSLYQNGNNPYYCDILKKITFAHVQIIKRIAGSFTGDFIDTFDSYALNHVDELLYELVSNTGIGTLKPGSIDDLIADLDTPAVYIFWLQINDKGAKERFGDCYHPSLSFSRKSVEMFDPTHIAVLKSLNLIESEIRTFQSVELDFEIEYFYYSLTPLGTDFYRSCAAPRSADWEP